MTANAVITGWGMYAPKRVMTNDELATMVDTSDEWIVTRTGIKERRIAAPDETTTGSLIGQPYRALLDFTHGRYAFCKIVQQPGELAIQRDPVMRIARACGGRS